MIKGIGVDIIEIDRISSSVERYGDSFLKKIYTDREIVYCTLKKGFKIPELAARFAAKEAFSKAIGTGIRGIGKDKNGAAWTDIEVVNDLLGKPQIYLKRKIAKKVHVSLSHSRDYAVATVYVEK
ncbi:holo-ACP synthase [Candidatus Saganbacteria bacterium]|nr:holo-ACP synthase [Candidatus Saganbacteria bacterium]